MGTRSKLHELLLTLAPNVYFQPPADFKMKYPCIRYQRDDVHTIFADNALYKSKKRYLVTVIDEDADSDIPDKVAELPLCSFDRFYTADSLNHDVFNLYF